MNVVLAMDFDGTLAHSVRCHREGDLCVERIDGVDHGFMSPHMVESLQAAKSIGCEIAIVTSRSASQYERIDWPSGTKPSLAFVDNGAYLIQSAQGHRKSVLYNSDNDMASLSVALALIGEEQSVKRCRLVDSCYVVAITEESDQQRGFEDIAVKTGLAYVRDGRKSYFFPPTLNKGIALQQLRSMGFSYIVSAGDNANDLALLKSADIALVPERTYKSANCNFPARVCPEGSSFEIFVATCINELVRRLGTKGGLDGRR